MFPNRSVAQGSPRWRPFVGVANGPGAAGWLVGAACVAAVLCLSLGPVAFLLWQAVHTAGTHAAEAVLTLDHFRAAYASPATARLLSNSLLFAAGTALVALLIGTPLAWLNERTDTPFKPLLFALALVPLIIPGILFTVAWMLLGSPRIGLVNLALRQLLDSRAVFVDVYSMGGMIFVDGLHYSPMAFLLMSAALRSMDPSLEESALTSGASLARTVRHVTLGLARPALLASLLIVFVRSIESFEVPALLGLPAGIQVFTSAIYEAAHRYPSGIGLASAHAVTLVAIAAAGLWLQARLSRGGQRFATITGKGFRPALLRLGRWRWVAASLVILDALLVAVLPLAALLWSSLQPFYSVPSPASMANLTLEAYRYLLRYPTLLASLWNSLLLAFGAATAVMFLGSVVAWIVVRAKARGGWLLDLAASLPMAIPGLVLGLSLMIAHLSLPLGLYGTMWILLLAYVTRFLPYGLRYTSVSMLQIHRELEESAQMSGAGWWATLGHIVMPLLRPGLVAGWIYVVIVSVRELSSAILLYAPGTEVVSVMIWELWENGQHAELSALGVVLVAVLVVLASAAQWLAGRFGLRLG